MIRVFIVAASPLSRANLKSLLRARKVEIVGSGPNLESLWDQPPEVEVDIVLIDASGDYFEEMMNSLNQSQLSSEAAVVVLSDRSEPGRLAEALRAGVRGILRSDASPDQIVAGLKAAAKRVSLSSSILPKLTPCFQQQRRHQVHSQNSLSRLRLARAKSFKCWRAAWRTRRSQHALRSLTTL